MTNFDILLTFFSTSPLLSQEEVMQHELQRNISDLSETSDIVTVNIDEDDYFSSSSSDDSE